MARCVSQVTERVLEVMDDPSVLIGLLKQLQRTFGWFHVVGFTAQVTLLMFPLVHAELLSETGVL